MMQALEVRMPFKDRLKRLRAAAGLTQQELATKAGIAMSSLAQMEAGTIANPRLNTLKALAAALGCGLLDLAESDDEPPAPPARRGRPRRK
jgi:transcriptional regulator with XRE-family HTH domain